MKKWPSLFINYCAAICKHQCFAENAKDKQLVFYMNWGPFISTELREQFTKETAGIKVIYSTYESNETMWYSKLLAHPSSYDLVVPSTYFA